MSFTELFKNGISFRAADLKEYKGSLSNPDRGWFHMYTFTVGAGETDTDNIFINPEDQLVLLLVSLRSALNRPRNNTDNARAEILSLIEHFYKAGKDIILRVVYDTSGHALESEPYDYEEVLRDAGMIGEVLGTAGYKVFIFQGLLVGNWGEMHTSRYADGASFTGIYDKLKNSGAGCFWAVRRPDIHRMLDNSSRKLGLFDDAILGSESDMGTYRDPDRDPEYESRVSSDAPNGGEAIYGGGYARNLGRNEIISFLTRKKVTYLNHDYDPKLLDMLKKDGDLYEYIGEHLGYRYKVEEVSYRKRDNVLRISVTNLGFAPVYRRTKSVIVLTDANWMVTELSVAMELDKIISGETCSAEICLGKEINEMRMPVRIGLKTQRAFDNKIIRYANTQTEDGSVLLGEFR